MASYIIKLAAYIFNTGADIMIHFVVRVVSYDSKTSKRLNLSTMPAQSLSDAFKLRESLNNMENRRAEVCVSVPTHNSTIVIEWDRVKELHKKLSEILAENDAPVKSIRDLVNR